MHLSDKKKDTDDKNVHVLVEQETWISTKNNPCDHLRIFYGIIICIDSTILVGQFSSYTFDPVGYLSKALFDEKFLQSIPPLHQNCFYSVFKPAYTGHLLQRPRGYQFDFSFVEMFGKASGQTHVIHQALADGAEGLKPQTMHALAEFVQLYVAQRVCHV